MTDSADALASALREATADAARWRAEAINHRGELMSARAEAMRAAAETIAERQRNQGQTEALEAMSRTVSWRITRPLRFVRKIGNRSGALAPTTSISPETVDPTSIDNKLLRRFQDRVCVVTAVLDQHSASADMSLGQAVLSFEQAIDRSSESVNAKAWLASLAVLGQYPDESAYEEAVRVCRLRGGHGLSELLLSRLEKASLDETTVDSQVEVLVGEVLIDVSESATHDLHTGIQRVVRELTSRWLSKPQVAVVHWNYWTNSVKRLSEDETERLRNWRSHLHDPGAAVQSRALAEDTGNTIVPWHCVLLLPELTVRPKTCAGYRSLARSGIITRCSLVGYDSVPMTAAETVTDGMTANFGHYLSLVKHATHLAAISEASAAEFRAFEQMLRSQGLPGPTVTARPLPTEPPTVSDEDLDRARQEFGVGALPVVLVVGSHEPRKNHVVVLEAAETMWRSGTTFDLIFAGGNSWGGSEFDTYLEELAVEGFPVRRYARIGEESLWSLYRLASFSVFPSLLEGYGLPIAESLASGTPVITSNYGSMAEIGAGGGAILVDPRDSEALASAMTDLLVNQEHRDVLAGEARARVFQTWDEYSESLWTDLVGPD